MIKDKRGFITGIITAVFAIVCLVIYLVNQETKYLTSCLIFVAYGAVSFIRAFSKKGLLEEISDNADERDLYVTMKSSHMVIKIMNYSIFTLTIIFLLLYSIMRQNYWLIMAGTLCGVLILMITVFLAVNVYLEKRE